MNVKPSKPTSKKLCCLSVVVMLVGSVFWNQVFDANAREQSQISNENPTASTEQADNKPEPTTHANNVVHFAIYADDMDRAKNFYTNVFGWKFTQWGVPDFYQVQTGHKDDMGIRGALQKRPGEKPGKAINGFECSVSVADLDRITKAIKANGGSIVLDNTEIPRVGNMVKFKDTEGNIAIAVEYFDGIN